MSQKLQQFMMHRETDPAVDTVVGFTGGGSRAARRPTAVISSWRSSPSHSAHASADQVIARLRPKLSAVAGARLFLQAVQDIRVGGRQSNAEYQYTLQADSAADLYHVGAAV